jgi:hypothetical protein
MIRMWRLTDVGEDNLGLACTDDGLSLGRTPLIERRGSNFVVRDRGEIQRLLSRAYRTEVTVDRLISGLASVASALEADDQCLARIAAVHLQLPDLPDRAARDSMEAEDSLIKLGDWNPALHPRIGTPPNPGWFAPTGASRDESSPIQIAQNDNPASRSDAAQSIGENRVVLPPGERNDELADLLQWIANAKPGDEKGIRAEIKRHYYDVGDTSGGDALSAALGNVLGPSVTYKDRQRILDSIGPYSISGSESDPSTDLLIGSSLLLLGMLPPGAAVETASAAWELGWAARGLYFSERLGANLPRNFKGIDAFVDGVATSIKSTDLRAATYQDATNLTYRLNEYVNKLIFYDGSRLGDIAIESSQISRRILSLAVPKGMTATQRAAIEATRLRTRAFNIELVVTEF